MCLLLRIWVSKRNQKKLIVRLLENGDVDLEFNPGLGPNGPVFCVRELPDGRIIIGGSFSKIGDVDCNSIAVLKTNGEIDDSLLSGMELMVKFMMWTG